MRTVEKKSSRVRASKRYFGVTLIGAVIALVVWAFFPVLLQKFFQALEWRLFHEAYSVTGSKVCCCSHELDYAVGFGGRAGLRALRTLQRDPNVTAEGHHVAARVAELIEKGEHLPYVRQFLDVPTSPLFRLHLQKILIRDMPYLIEGEAKK